MNISKGPSRKQTDPSTITHFRLRSIHTPPSFLRAKMVLLDTNGFNAIFLIAVGTTLFGATGSSAFATGPNAIANNTYKILVAGVIAHTFKLVWHSQAYPLEDRLRYFHIRFQFTI